MYDPLPFFFKSVKPFSDMNSREVGPDFLCSDGFTTATNPQQGSGEGGGGGPAHRPWHWLWPPQTLLTSSSVLSMFSSLLFHPQIFVRVFLYFCARHMFGSSPPLARDESCGGSPAVASPPVAHFAFRPLRRESEGSLEFSACLKAAYDTNTTRTHDYCCWRSR